MQNTLLSETYTMPDRRSYCPLPTFCRLPSPRQQSRYLSAFLLLLIAQEARHGGALLEAMKKDIPSLQADSPSVYRALRQLEKNGEVKSIWNVTKGGPALRTYRLTAAGRKKLGIWLEEIRGRLDAFAYFVGTYKKIATARPLK